MKISTLKEQPHLFQQTLKLIESSFGYEKENSFYNDFYPLMNKKNHEHLYIMFDQDRVIAHIGTLTKKIQLTNNTYLFTMFGGIAVSKKYRGKGLFKKLFNHALAESKNEQAFYLLWSDKVELYQQFGFYPCGELKNFSKKPTPSDFKKENFINLNSHDQKSVKDLYSSSNEIRPMRSKEDWHELFEMNSVDLFIRRNEDNQIKNYFCMGKGQDLTGIIHEFGKAEESMLNHGDLWTIDKFDLPFTTLNAFSMKVGPLFNQFIKDYVDMEVIEIEKKVKFKFEGETFNLEIDDFLSGIFGPGRFNELSIPYLYIPGVISI